MVQIRPMQMPDTEAVAALEAVCFSDPWQLATIRGELSNPLSLWLVAEQGGTVCGYVGSQTCGEESDMMNLAVSPEARRRGVAAKLVTELLQKLFAGGSRSLTLEVRAGNAAAIALYEKLGFQTVGRRPRYYFHPTEDALILRKEMEKLENTCD